MNDYELWNKCVLYKLEHKAGRKDTTVDIDVLRTYYTQLKEIRKFPKERED